MLDYPLYPNIKFDYRSSEMPAKASDGEERTHTEEYNVFCLAYIYVII